MKIEFKNLETQHTSCENEMHKLYQMYIDIGQAHAIAIFLYMRDNEWSQKDINKQIDVMIENLDDDSKLYMLKFKESLNIIK